MTAAAPVLEHQADADETGEAPQHSGLNRALDIAGICAGVILGVILFDIVSGGRLTRWARARRGPAPGGPCEGCNEDKDRTGDDN